MPIAVRTIVAIGLTGGLVLAGAFVTVREFLLSPGVRAQPADTFRPPPDPATGEPREPRWFEPLLREDEAKAEFDGEMNGIRIGRSVDRILADHPACSDVSQHRASHEPHEAAGTEIDPYPAYLPAGAQGEQFGASICGDTIINAGVEFTFEVGTASAWGGTFSVVRMRGDHSVHAIWSTDRLRAVEVDGRRAVLVEPLTEDGWGSAALYVHEAWGMTLVQAANLTSDDMIRIAESLSREGGVR